MANPEDRPDHRTASAEPAADEGTSSRHQVGRLAAAVGAGLAVWLTPVPEGVDPRAWQLPAVFVALLGLWIFGSSLGVGSVWWKMLGLW